MKKYIINFWDKKKMKPKFIKEDLSIGEIILFFADGSKLWQGKQKNERFNGIYKKFIEYNMPCRFLYLKKDKMQGIKIDFKL